MIKKRDTIHRMANARGWLVSALVGLLSLGGCGEIVIVAGSAGGGGGTTASGSAGGGAGTATASSTTSISGTGGATTSSSSAGGGGCGGTDVICGGACVDLQVDPANCGVCGDACPPGILCSLGSCWCECPAGMIVCGDCTCLNPATDPSNCGACGVACGPNGACVGGACGACKPHFADCDGNAGNGCEVDTSSDAKNCGACGALCAGPNGAVACIGGTCGCAGCQPGFANCDNICANGCEINTSVDPKNCGTCGHACAAGQVCTGGTCG
jgi:hypothetical protein